MTEKILGAAALILALCCWSLYTDKVDLERQILTAKAEQARAIVVAVEEQTRELVRRTNVQRKALDAQIVETQAAEADADRLRGSERRMRDKLAAIGASSRQAVANQPAAGDGAAVEVLIDVLGSCISEYRKLAIEAERARTAGLFCERSYDALIPQEGGDLSK